ncbi:unnamed protein product [Cochlearia groenlandica]
MVTIEASHLCTFQYTIKAKCKNGHIMMFDAMSKLKTHNVNTCQSSVFDFAGLKWKMIIYPWGKDGTKDYLSFYLRIKDKESLGSDWEVTCTVKLTIVYEYGLFVRDITQWLVVSYNEQDAINGIDNFMPNKFLKYEDLKGALRMCFCVEITNVQTNFPIKTFNLFQSLATKEHLKLIDVPKNNSRFTWKITQFSSFDGESHSSYEFTVGPRRWKLIMYPKGLGDGEGNSLSLYLMATDYVTKGPNAKTLAVFKLRVFDQLRRNHHEIGYDNWFLHDPNSPLDCCWGSHTYLPLVKLYDPSNGFLVNDQMYITVEFSLVSTTTNG